MRAYESWQAGAKQREKQKERAGKRRPDEGSGPQDTAYETSWEASFDPSEPSKDFSFAGDYVNISKEDVDDGIASLAKWGRVDERALAALKRGIGIHHSGMNKIYRSLVERYPSGDPKSNFPLTTTPLVGSVRGICVWLLLQVRPPKRPPNIVEGRLLTLKLGTLALGMQWRCPWMSIDLTSRHRDKRPNKNFRVYRRLAIPHSIDGE